MVEEITKKMTNVELKAEFHIIYFTIGTIHYFLKYMFRRDELIPDQVVHYQAKGTCPFCKKNASEKALCIGAYPEKEEITALFERLLNHPNVRVKALTLGVMKKIKTISEEGNK